MVDHRETGTKQRFLLGLSLVYVVTGLALNAASVTVLRGSLQIQTRASVIAVIVWAAVFTFMAGAGAVRSWWTLSNWGFSLNRKWWISSGLVIVSLAFMLLQQSVPVWGSDPFFVIKMVGATLEEVVFRGLLIGLLVQVFRSSAKGVMLAIAVSAALFTLVHIPTKSGVELIGLFTSALLMGYIFHVTQSLLFPIFAHVMANTVHDSGFKGGICCIGLYFAVAALGYFLDKRVRSIAVDA